MTYEEKYSKCKTIKELNDEHFYDEHAINNVVEYGICKRAYEKRYKELLKEQNLK